MKAIDWKAEYTAAAKERATLEGRVLRTALHPKRVGENEGLDQPTLARFIELTDTMRRAGDMVARPNQLTEESG